MSKVPLYTPRHSKKVSSGIGQSQRCPQQRAGDEYNSAPSGSPQRSIILKLAKHFSIFPLSTLPLEITPHPLVEFLSRQDFGDTDHGVHTSERPTNGLIVQHVTASFEIRTRLCKSVQTVGKLDHTAP